ncbi:hypothetical protein HAX54_040689, partial [Datura stramonium]|nr:hypothetical protein [Datura stramonium]
MAKSDSNSDEESSEGTITNKNSRPKGTISSLKDEILNLKKVQTVSKGQASTDKRSLESEITTLEFDLNKE